MVWKKEKTVQPRDSTHCWEGVAGHGKQEVTAKFRKIYPRFRQIGSHHFSWVDVICVERLRKRREITWKDCRRMLLHWASWVKGNIWNHFSDFECVCFGLFYFFSEEDGLNSIYLKDYAKTRMKCFPKIQYLQLSSWLLEGWFSLLLSHTSPGTMEIRSCYRRGQKEGTALKGTRDGKYWNIY